ncbi:kinase/pyrophosphorylase [Legionella geestiana]|uniref:posphoenolpyruvate synthetase regulatory kinase/phosphorylase PpsR n=1 Tax=Legionella geestiana TaxID=45065 RepID=UPI001092CA09|nr:pyruvate, water dikinase regulatory protein [Legionella geestiana]QDQ40910.1 kinase/pyrophosphorylase [Legionella geestiana]
MKRYVFMVSDGTGITAETLGNSLVSQFEKVPFEKETLSYVDTLEKAEKVVEVLNACYRNTGTRPIVFLTLVDRELNNCIKKSDACIFDLFNTFLLPLEEALEEKSSHTVGRTHGVQDVKTYDYRIEAINYALEHDDGIKPRGYEHADVILVGVSRCGKTPSSLYLALQFGLRVANYPFTEEDLKRHTLPDALKPWRPKLFGLTIDCERLQQIRSERRPDSKYASMEQCRIETREVESLYGREQIPYLNSTFCSIEEIATRILAITGIKRRI